MPSPLYNAFGNRPSGNTGNIFQQFNQFKRMFNGNPKQQVQELLNSGRMSQSQFNHLKQMAEQFERMMR